MPSQVPPYPLFDADNREAGPRLELMEELGIQRTLMFPTLVGGNLARLIAA